MEGDVCSFTNKTSEGQYHTKLERYCTKFSVSPWLMNMYSFMELMWNL